MDEHEKRRGSDSFIRSYSSGWFFVGRDMMWVWLRGNVFVCILGVLKKLSLFFFVNL